MKSLKTLKDLEADFECGWGKYHINTKELKAEAIKWVKSYRELKPFPQVNMDEEDWIHFFNITEDDLA